jgi:hypothetical protein
MIFMTVSLARVRMLTEAGIRPQVIAANVFGQYNKRVKILSAC